MSVEVVEVGNVDALLHEEHLGSQRCDPEELVPGQFFPAPDLNRDLHDSLHSPTIARIPQVTTQPPLWWRGVTLRLQVFSRSDVL